MNIRGKSYNSRTVKIYIYIPTYREVVILLWVSLMVTKNAIYLEK